MIFRLTIGVSAAGQSLARIDAGSLDAGQLSFTLGIDGALGSSHSLTTVLIGVADHPGSATAFESAVFVDALSAGTARIVPTFVDVDAAD